jgi:hypothetical protein
MKLYDKTAKQLIDVNPSDVPAALATGKFSFEKNQKVPINYEGKLMFTTPEYAGRYRDRLTFANEADVEQASAERATSGIGGAVEATALGLGKALTLGAGPAVLGAVSETARERMRELELGRPNITAAAEFGGLLVDPFALAGRVGQRLAGRGAAQAAEVAAAQRAAVSPALRLGEAATGAVVPPAQTAVRAAEQTLELGGQRAAMGGVSQAMPTLGGAQALAPTAEEAASLAFRSRARQSMAGRGQAAARAAEEQAAADELSLAFRPSTGPVSPAEPGLRLGADPFRTPELAMRARQAEELTTRAAGARAAEARAAEEAAAMERGLAPGQVGPVEDFAQMPSSAMESEFLQSELSRIDDALEANAAAARRARSQASRDRIGAERERLLAERERLDVGAMRTGIQAEEDLAAQAGRAFEATQMQAAAPARALEAERMGRMAGEIEAANVATASPRAATAPIPENVSPAMSFGERIAGLRGEVTPPNVSPAGIGALETPGMVSAPGALRMGPAGRMAEEAVEGGAGLRLGEAPRGAQEALGDLAAGAPMPQLPAMPKAPYEPTVAGQALQGAVYGGASQAYKQELGLEPGGVGEVLAATALGGAIGKGLSLGGKALVKGQKALTDVAAESAPSSLASMIGKAASSVERTHLLRQWGQSQKAVRKLNERFTEDELGKLGSTAMTDYVRNAAARIEELKAAHPENQFLQSINVGTKGLTFTNLSAEQRNAMAQVLREEAGKAVEAMYGPALNQVVSPQAIDAALARVEKKLRTRGMGDIPLQDIRAELDALRESLAKREPYTVGDLRQYEIATSRRFQERQGIHEPLTSAQSTFRNEIKNLYLDAAEQVTPGIRQQLVVPNRNYTLADMLAVGAEDALAKGETTSAVGRDSLAQFALGAFAMVQPIPAALFFLGTTALRGLYNQRGDGFIADMAGKVARKSASVAAAPEVAAREVTQSILNAQRPLLGAFNAEKLVDVKPTDYTSLSQGIRELAASTDFAHERIRQATANLPPDQQERFIADYDATMQKLVDEMPKGIPTQKALSEAERRWTVMARSLFDHAYATQLIANGGPMAPAAAQGLAMIPNGQKYLDELASNLQRAIAENEKLRGDQQLATVARNFAKVKTGVGGIRIQRIVSGMGQQAFQPPAGGRLPTPGASGQAAARNAFGAATAGQR